MHINTHKSHTYLHAPSGSHSVSSGQESSGEAPPKIAGDYSGFTKFSGGEGEREKREGNQYIFKQKAEQTGFRVHLSGRVSGVKY